MSGNLSPSSTNNNQPQSQQQPQQQPPPQVPVPTASVMCCANSGRNSVTDPVSGQTVCSCQYDSTRINLSQYSHPIGVYSATPYPSTNQNPYQSIAMDSSAYFPSLVSTIIIMTIPQSQSKNGPFGSRAKKAHNLTFYLSRGAERRGATLFKILLFLESLINLCHGKNVHCFQKGMLHICTLNLFF